MQKRPAATGERSATTFHIERDDVRRRITVTVVGPLVRADIMTMIRGVRSGAGALYTLLLDMRQATELPTTGDIQSIATELDIRSRQSARGRAAILGTPGVTFGHARSFEQWCEAFGVHTVRACASLEEAEAWLAGQDVSRKD